MKRETPALSAALGESETRSAAVTRWTPAQTASREEVVNLSEAT